MSGNIPFYAKNGIVANLSFTANSTIITIPNTAQIIANGATGASGTVLASNGTGTFWQSIGALSLNTASTYAWTNTQTFSANITFTANLIGNTISSNTIINTANISTNNITTSTANVTNITITANLTSNISSVNVGTYSTLTVNNNLTVGNTSLSSNGLTVYSGSNSAIFAESLSYYGIYAISNTASGLYVSQFSNSSTYYSALTITSNNQIGGANYAGLLTLTNSAGGSNPNKYIRINSTGGLEIINSAYSSVLYTFDNSGNFTALQNITAYSDERLKSNISTISNALDKVKALRGVEFDKDEKHNIGVIAQEVRKVIPEVVHESADENKTLSVAYGNLIGLLIEAIKELSKKVENLKNDA